MEIVFAMGPVSLFRGRGCKVSIASSSGRRRCRLRGRRICS